VRDDDVRVLASTPFPLEFETEIKFSVSVRGDELRASVGEIQLTARDDSEWALSDGGIGLLIADGALSTDEVRVPAVEGGRDSRTGRVVS
jgi:hypothetical protein